MEINVLGQVSFVSVRAGRLAFAFFWAMPAVAAGHSSIRPPDDRAWSAREIRNERVTLTLMQLAFGLHEFLFVNKRYEGKYSIAPGGGT